ncbi:hypothetical protein EFE42_00495 [Methanohalophilus sp. RSK]|nr:hypothetical protein EFE42_00495 [Methanohalophilus sp. RSK]
MFARSYSGRVGVHIPLIFFFFCCHSLGKIVTFSRLHTGTVFCILADMMDLCKPCNVAHLISGGGFVNRAASIFPVLLAQDYSSNKSSILYIHKIL